LHVRRARGRSPAEPAPLLLWRVITSAACGCAGAEEFVMTRVPGSDQLEPPRRPPAQPGDPAVCKRCGKPVELLTVISQLGNTYRIFGRAACSFLDWVQQKT